MPALVPRAAGAGSKVGQPGIHRTLAKRASGTAIIHIILAHGDIPSARISRSHPYGAESEVAIACISHIAAETMKTEKPWNSRSDM